MTDSISVDNKNISDAFIDRCWKCAITGILFVLLFREHLAKLVGLWKTADGSHGILIPAFSLYFIYQVRERLGRTVGRPSYWGLIVMMLSLLGFLFFIYAQIYYLQLITMIFMIGGIVLFLGGWSIFHLTWLPIVYLIFAMPLPGRVHTAITMPLRELASDITAVILSLFPHVYCEAAGVVIRGSHLGREFNLNVAEACSGMRLLMAFVALGVAMAYLEYRPFVHRMVLLFSTVPIAIFCNIVRVLVTGMIHIYIGAQFAEGLLHTLLGLLMLILAFALYGGLAWVLNNFLVEDDVAEQDVLVVRKSE